MKLYTVGYEQQDIEEFCSKLRKHKINLLIDVRKNPISRKKGFSKKKLSENLLSHKIKYLHFTNLGVPTYWRKLAKAKMLTREKMFRDYKEKILPKFKVDIDEIKKLRKTQRIVLMCYEKDATDCHRSYLAKKIAPKSQTVNINL